jgi:hypothetical protein
MSFETAVFFTTFVFLGARLVLLGRKSNQVTQAQERQHVAEVHELVRPVLLFSTKAPVALC